MEVSQCKHSHEQNKMLKFPIPGFQILVLEITTIPLFMLEIADFSVFRDNSKNVSNKVNTRLKVTRR